MNLLDETLEDMQRLGKTPEDIVFIGSVKSGYYCTWEQFELLANQEYDAGFGSQKVANDLIIAFNDGKKMWRSEYDGSEAWEFDEPFIMPTDIKPIKKLFVNDVGWEDLNEIHNPD